MTDIGDWISETDVEGTWMDPAYMLRFWEQTRGALWHWSDWETAMAYRDQLPRGHGLIMIMGMSCPIPTNAYATNLVTSLS